MTHKRILSFIGWEINCLKKKTKKTELYKKKKIQRITNNIILQNMLFVISIHGARCCPFQTLKNVNVHNGNLISLGVSSKQFQRSNWENVTEDLQM